MYSYKIHKKIRLILRNFVCRTFQRKCDNHANNNFEASKFNISKFSYFSKFKDQSSLSFCFVHMDLSNVKTEIMLGDFKLRALQLCFFIFSRHISVICFFKFYVITKFYLNHYNYTYLILFSSQWQKKINIFSEFSS